MTPRKTILLIAAAMLLLGGSWSSMREGKTIAQRQPTASRSKSRAALRETNMADQGAGATAEAPVLDVTVARREAAGLVRALYRKEQLARELDLEQLRYGQYYWSAEHGALELTKLQQSRDAMLAQLNAEANQVLSDLFPGVTGEPVSLTSIFSVERRGPNLTFLSPAQRERFEAEILATDDGRGVDEPAQLETIAARVLAPGEMNSYRQWNDPAAVALRAQLVGFHPIEGEFIAIEREMRSVAADGETPDPAGNLERTLGSSRFAEFQKSREPALLTAVNDLQRLGLPLDEASWLAATRARATADLGEIWQSTALTDAMKRDRVMQVEHFYGQAIAAKLGLPTATLDGIGPSS